MLIFAFISSFRRNLYPPLTFISTSTRKNGFVMRNFEGDRGVVDTPLFVADTAGGKLNEEFEHYEIEADEE